jgi:hypothetical protein
MAEPIVQGFETIVNCFEIDRSLPMPSGDMPAAIAAGANGTQISAVHRKVHGTLFGMSAAEG